MLQVTLHATTGSLMQEDECAVSIVPAATLETLPGWFTLTLQSVPVRQGMHFLLMGGCQVPPVKFYLEEYISNPDITSE